MKLFRLNRAPMVGKSGYNYRVLGEDDAPKNHHLLGFETLVVSVASPNNYNADWRGHENVLNVLFWDVRPESESAGMPCLSDSQADEIARRVLDHGGIRFVFQCEAGVSRSAGLCVALALQFGDDEVAAECYERYCPNELVVERMADAFDRATVYESEAIQSKRGKT